MSLQIVIVAIIDEEVQYVEDDILLNDLKVIELTKILDKGYATLSLRKLVILQPHLDFF